MVVAIPSAIHPKASYVFFPRCETAHCSRLSSDNANAHNSPIEYPLSRGMESQ